MNESSRIIFSPGWAYLTMVFNGCGALINALYGTNDKMFWVWIAAMVCWAMIACASAIVKAIEGDKHENHSQYRQTKKTEILVSHDRD